MARRFNLKKCTYVLNLTLLAGALFMGFSAGAQQSQWLIAAGVLSMLLVFFAVFFHFLERTLGASPEQLVAIMDAIAQGDLAFPVPAKIASKHSVLAKTLLVRQRLQSVIEEVDSITGQLVSGSKNIDGIAASLSKGVTNQVQHVQQTADSIYQISGSIAQNRQNASDTDAIAKKASLDADNCNEAVIATIDAMQRIADRTSVINEIAYQTNLLALNAAIEAGRAGEHGRGFAVVAAEIRKLSARCQQAAAQIGEVANESVHQSETAGQLLIQMVQSIRQTADMLQGIVTSSQEQAVGVQMIQGAISQVRQTLQETVTSTDGLSGTTDALQQQVESMQQLVRGFRPPQPDKPLEKAPRKVRATVAVASSPVVKRAPVAITSTPVKLPAKPNLKTTNPNAVSRKVVIPARVAAKPGQASAAPGADADDRFFIEFD